MRSRAFLPAGIFAAILSTAAAAAATAPTLLGAFGGWSAYQSTTGDGRTCYVMAQPKSSEPKKAVRDPIYFLISDWPRRKAKSEMQIIPGYKYKDGSNPFWTAVQVRNSRYPISKLESSKDGVSFVEAQRQNYNYFLNGGGFGSGSTQVRITGVTGDTLVDTLPEVQASLEVAGQAQFPAAAQ